MLLIPITKTTAARNGVALNYHSVRGLYFLAVVFVRSIVSNTINLVILKTVTSASAGWMLFN